METSTKVDYQIITTTIADWDQIVKLFENVISGQASNGYRVWDSIDWEALRKDIENQLHYKITSGGQVIGLFNVQYSDPLLWGEKDQLNALYLHRILADPAFKGQKLFGIVLAWAKKKALQKKLQYIRLDTWADNLRIIDYYKSYGFVEVGHYTTGNTEQLPLQNRNLQGILLELNLR
jgi:GNAT superfamily N-acetyltransferase